MRAIKGKKQDEQLRSTLPGPANLSHRGYQGEIPAAPQDAGTGSRETAASAHAFSEARAQAYQHRDKARLHEFGMLELAASSSPCRLPRFHLHMCMCIPGFPLPHFVYAVLFIIYLTQFVVCVTSSLPIRIPRRSKTALTNRTPGLDFSQHWGDCRDRMRETRLSLKKVTCCRRSRACLVAYLLVSCPVLVS